LKKSSSFSIFFFAKEKKKEKLEEPKVGEKMEELNFREAMISMMLFLLKDNSNEVINLCSTNNYMLSLCHTPIDYVKHRIPFSIDENMLIEKNIKTILGLAYLIRQNDIRKCLLWGWLLFTKTDTNIRKKFLGFDYSKVKKNDLILYTSSSPYTLNYNDVFYVMWSSGGILPYLWRKANTIPVRSTQKPSAYGMIGPTYKQISQLINMEGGIPLHKTKINENDFVQYIYTLDISNVIPTNIEKNYKELKQYIQSPKFRLEVEEYLESLIKEILFPTEKEKPIYEITTLCKDAKFFDYFNVDLYGKLRGIYTLILYAKVNPTLNDWNPAGIPYWLNLL
jgi:hypothetical protein